MVHPFPTGQRLLKTRGNDCLAAEYLDVVEVIRPRRRDFRKNARPMKRREVEFDDALRHDDVEVLAFSFDALDGSRRAVDDGRYLRLILMDHRNLRLADKRHIIAVAPDRFGFIRIKRGSRGRRRQGWKRSSER